MRHDRQRRPGLGAAISAPCILPQVNDIAIDLQSADVSAIELRTPFDLLVVIYYGRWESRHKATFVLEYSVLLVCL